jgi:hypothetical protein
LVEIAEFDAGAEDVPKPLAHPVGSEIDHNARMCSPPDARPLTAGTDLAIRATIDREDGATRDGRARLKALGAYSYAARHAVQSAE